MLYNNKFAELPPSYHAYYCWLHLAIPTYSSILVQFVVYKRKTPKINLLQTPLGTVTNQ